MSHDSAISASGATDSTTAYEAPRLDDLGTLADLTQGEGGEGADVFGESSVGPT